MAFWIDPMLKPAGEENMKMIVGVLVLIAIIAIGLRGMWESDSNRVTAMRLLESRVSGLENTVDAMNGQLIALQKPKDKKGKKADSGMPTPVPVRRYYYPAFQ